MLRRFALLSLLAIAGAATGAALYKFLPQFYRSEAIIRSNNLASNIVVGNIERLEALFLGQNSQELSRLLNMSESEATKIRRLTPYYGIMPHGQNADGLNVPAYYICSNLIDTISDGISKYIKIVADVTDEDIYPKLMQGLLYFINSSYFCKELNIVRVDLLKAQVAHAERGIITLQQQQAAFTKQGSSMPSLPLQLELNKTPQKGELIQLQEAIDGLYSKKVNLEQELALFAQPAVIVTDFSKTYRFVHGLHTYMVAGAAAAFALGLAALALKENRKKIINAIYGKT
ncbi:MAG: hypothetical protein LBK18_01685 [Prevotellaceae bacterium]|nr:hypothetical protein [Prevotellaceae bacterium]